MDICVERQMSLMPIRLIFMLESIDLPENHGRTTKEAHRAGWDTSHSHNELLSHGLGSPRGTPRGPLEETMGRRHRSLAPALEIGPLGTHGRFPRRVR
jgi:hypothetical protein